MTAFRPKITVCDDLAEMAAVAREQILSVVAAAPADKQVSLALSGGSTPKRLYELMHEKDLALLRDAQRVLFFLGDERLHPLGHKQSNYRMASEALLRDVPEACVLPVDTAPAVATSEDVANGEAGARAAAKGYEALLLSRLDTATVTPVGGTAPVALPVADIVLLGFGSDGHTASVFPNSVAEKDTAAAVSVSFPSPTMVPKVWRATLTPAAICEARHVVVLAAGKDKQWVIDGILQQSPPSDEAACPVARFLRDCKGTVHFILDKASGANVHL